MRPTPLPPNDPSFARAREALVASLRTDVRDDRVLDAFEKVPRERFVGADLAFRAYEDRPLPIGHGQTTSQPRMIALMLQELGLKGTARVLELGTGSGYETALLSELAAEVVSVELIPSLAEGAARVLQELGYGNFTLHVAGDELGWPQSAPYHAIVVAAGSPRVPPSLVDQLAPGGRMVIPVGSREEQDLLLIERRPEGTTIYRRGGCRFVPLIGSEAFASD